MAQELATQPTKKCLPASCKPILDSLRTHGKEFDMWKCGDLPVITEDLKTAAQAGLMFVEERLTPASTDGTKAAIFALLQHFYVGNLPDAVHQAIATDWLFCLEKFPSWAIENARIEWLKSSNIKPKPKNIIDLCEKAVSKDKAMRRQCQAILAAPITPTPAPELTEEERTARASEIDKVIAEAKKNLTGGEANE